MNYATFSIRLTSDQVLKYYKGLRQTVRVQTDSGVNMSIPYDILLKYVTHGGISGRFQISYDDNGKLIDLVKLS